MFQKITITGASGFIGKNLRTYFETKGSEVQALSLRNPDWKDKLNSRANVLIHLAGIAHDTANTKEADDYIKVNRDLTATLFREFLRSDIRDFIFFSSVKAAADTVEDILTENILPDPQTPYGKSKLEAENYIRQYTVPAGKRVFILRPAMVHGPGNKGNLNLLYKLVKKGIPWPLASFQNKRSFIGVDNLNFIVNELIRNKKVESGIYNVADDSPLSTNELIGVIASKFRRKSRLWKLNPSFIKAVAKAGDWMKLPLNSERLAKLTESYVVSNTKILKALGQNSLPLTALEGMKKTIENFE